MSNEIYNDGCGKYHSICETCGCIEGHGCPDSKACYTEQIKELETLLLGKEEELRFIKVIVKRLNQGEFNWAASIYQSEMDKIRIYPREHYLLFQIFGCRAHLSHNCTNDLCLSLNPKG